MRTATVICLFLLACSGDDSVDEDCITANNVAISVGASTHDCSASTAGQFAEIIRLAYAPVGLCSPIDDLMGTTTYAGCSVSAVLNGTWNDGDATFIGNAGLTLSGCADACMAGINVTFDRLEAQ